MRSVFLSITVILALLSAVAHAIVPAMGATRPAARARHAMVVGSEPLALTEGLKVLREGGNAVDAAITIAFALAVTHPRAGNIGGGGFMLVRAPDGSTNCIDYRETAPAAATRDMFLDPNGNTDEVASRQSHRASGVPGTVAGLTLALRRHGTIPLRRAIAPAIRLAADGFTVGRELEQELATDERTIARFPATRAVFFRDGHTLTEGMVLRQPDLAATLRAIRDKGSDGFYRGRVAQTLAADMKTHGGLITQEDLAAYQPIERPVLTGTFRSYEIISAPPPSSGGVALVQILHMLEPYDLKGLGHNSSAYIHLLSEVFKRAFADRSRWLGDPAFFDVPLERLLSRDYATGMMRGFDPNQATPAAAAGPGDPSPREKPSTTHFSIVDATGMIVSNTYTLNDSFGSGVMAEGLGFLMNNQMDDFSTRPGSPNLYGLVGGEANSIAPGKRMLSSMSPTIVLRKDSATSRSIPFLVLGSPGGPAIITSVAQVILDITEFGIEPQTAVNAPRFHHQWLPDRIWLDRGMFPVDVIEALKRRGHDVAERDPRGEVETILVDPEGQWLFGASDARARGAAVGY